MTINKMSRREKYDNIVLNYNFPNLGDKDPGMPAPSLEDVKDSGKNDYFTISEKKDGENT